MHSPADRHSLGWRERAHIHGWWSQEVRVTTSAHDPPPPHRLRTVVYGHGVCPEGRPVCWEVHGYGPSVRFGLPADIDWSERDASGQPWRLRRLWDLMLAAGCRHYPVRDLHAQSSSSSSSSGPSMSAPSTSSGKGSNIDHAPMSPECMYHCWTPIVKNADELPTVEYRRPLYYAHLRWDESAQKYAAALQPFLTVHFHHRAALQHFVRQCTLKPLVEHRMGSIELTVWEDHRSLGAVEKMLVEYSLPTVGWLAFRHAQHPAGRPPSQFVRGHVQELSRDLVAQETRGRPSVTVLSFDIECYASVEGTFPDADNPADVVFQIGCVLSTVAAGTDRTQYRRVLLSLLDPDANDPLLVRRGVQVRSFASEYDLLIGFRDIIREWAPQVVVGYNVFGFDWKYLTARADKKWRCLSEFMAFGARTSAGWVPGQLVTSGANVKFQSTTYVDAESILMMDLLPFIRAGYKLANYRLKTVAVRFLSGTKDKDNSESKSKSKGKDDKGKGFKGKDRVDDGGSTAMDEDEGEDEDENEVKDEDEDEDEDDDVTKDPLTPKDIFRLYAEGTPAGMAQVGAYCVQDAELVSLLFAKLLVWYSVCESASINNVPIPFLYTRGEQIRMFYSVFRYAHQHQICVNMPIHDRDRDRSGGAKAKKFKGAEVLPPVKGMHHNIQTFDFSSLYPSIIQAYNLDYTTLLRPPTTADTPVLTGTSASTHPSSEPAIDVQHCHIFRWTDHVPGCTCAPDSSLSAGPKSTSGSLSSSSSVFLANWLTRTGAKDAPLPSRPASAPPERACVDHEYHFVREEMCAMGPGVVPSLLRGLLGARKLARAQEERYRSLAEAEGDAAEAEIASLGGREAVRGLAGVFEKRQNAYKVSANSMYGAMGASNGFLPIKPVAMCIPFVGRVSIRKVVTFMEAAPNHGKVVYGDTDSAFVGFPGLGPAERTPEKLAALGQRLAKAASALFPPPMKLEFERAFLQLLLLSKKRYIGIVAGKSELYQKGVATSRRDSCGVVHTFFGAAARAIFGLGYDPSACPAPPLARTMAALAGCVQNLMARGGYPLTDFVLTKELTSNPAEYKSMPPHAGVAERMRIERGQEVPKKTRMELVLVRRPTPGLRPYAEDAGAKQEERMEDVEYFRTHRAYLELDLFQYWESQIANPLDEILHVAFPDRCKLGRRGGKAAALGTPMMAWLQERRQFAQCMWELRSKIGPHRLVFAQDDTDADRTPSVQTDLIQMGFEISTTSRRGPKKKVYVGGVGARPGTGSVLLRPLRRWSEW